eukprot:TRINITY_DN20939_c0_g1_i1.p1 TRINITY_DN20939_c0_g1~~TRINITY_DN20939_c0_g1_i1.p1  ORF type:complete len:349 (+),score=82.71 TRINITY_DN20939_c0_g1_i1:84-1130(+)
MSETQVWEVIAGKDKGGIVVREDKSIKSKELGRLSFASYVEEIELAGDRLNYKKLAGTGPETGWVSLKLADKDLLKCIIKREPPKPPLFCAWYSGGFFKKDGEKLLAPLIDAVQKAGLEDTAVLHFPNEYDMIGEGREAWASYVDRLVEEINKAAGDDKRSIVVFGHSRGASPAICVATRLGARCKKVYIAACGAMVKGQATAWENLSMAFKQGGDRDLLKWFSSLQPENVVLSRTANDTTDAEFEEHVKSSKFMSEMLGLMRTQYRNAMYPDPDKDFTVVLAPIMAFSPIQDAGSGPEVTQGWGELTSGGFQLETVDAGHMDCLAPNPEGKCELFEKISKDLQQFVS